MKRKILTGFILTLIAGLLVTFTSCNSGSKSKTETTASDVKATSELVQGVFEVAPPFQGYVIYLDDYFLFMIGTSDSTMRCTGGKYEISGDTITDIKLFSTNLDEVGTRQQWKAEPMEGNKLKVTLFNKDGSISGAVEMTKTVNRAEIKSQMTDIEGFFQYLPPLQGQAVNLAGYYIYLFGTSENTMSANAGTYINHNDTITDKYLFSTSPELVGGEFNWMNQSTVGDTFTYAILSDIEEEVPMTGQSVRIK